MEARVGDLDYFGSLIEGIDYAEGVNCLGELALVLEDKVDKYNPERMAIFFNQLNNLTGRAKKVIRLCLDCPPELERVVMAKDNHHFYLTVGDLKNYLRYYGWKMRQVDAVMEEIKNIF